MSPPVSPPPTGTSAPLSLLPLTALLPSPISSPPRSSVCTRITPRTPLPSSSGDRSPQPLGRDENSNLLLSRAEESFGLSAGRGLWFQSGVVLGCRANGGLCVCGHGPGHPGPSSLTGP